MRVRGNVPADASIGVAIIRIRMMNVAVIVAVFVGDGRLGEPEHIGGR